jgi:undecaprenyl-diphosphatase
MIRHLNHFTGQLMEKDYLRLAFGICVLIVATLLFIAIANHALSDTWLTRIDMQVSNWLHAHTLPALTVVMLVITDIHRPLGIGMLASGCALLLLWKRRWYSLLALALAVPGGMLLNIALKNLFQRARPVFDEPLLTLATYSFPSGHVMGSTVFYGVLVAFVFWNVRGWCWRLLMLAIACSMIMLVAFSRLYLGVHYVSDVTAAFIEGLAWLSLCLIIVDILWRYRRRRARIPT